MRQFYLLPHRDEAGRDHGSCLSWLHYGPKCGVNGGLSETQTQNPLIRSRVLCRLKLPPPPLFFPPNPHIEVSNEASICVCVCEGILKHFQNGNLKKKKSMSCICIALHGAVGAFAPVVFNGSRAFTAVAFKLPRL